MIGSGRYTCERHTIGLLQRRHIQIDCIKYIGKESNALEEVEAGLVHSDQSVYTEYCDPRRDEWTVKILPILKKTPLRILITETGLSRRELIRLRLNQRRPHRATREKVVKALRRLGLI